MLKDQRNKKPIQDYLMNLFISLQYLAQTENKRYTNVVHINLYMINSLTHMKYQNKIKQAFTYNRSKVPLVKKKEKNKTNINNIIGNKTKQIFTCFLLKLKLQLCTQWVVRAPSLRETGELVSSGRNFLKSRKKQSQC